MKKIIMTRNEFEALTRCKDCRHFHKYRLRSEMPYHEENLPEDQVEVSEDIDTYSRCLVGAGHMPPMDLTECIIVDCNQFERRESKRKL